MPEKQKLPQPPLDPRGGQNEPNPMAAGVPEEDTTPGQDRNYDPNFDRDYAGGPDDD